ncbi:MAG: hypothetical protein JRG73_21100 [Deltaproteobacteria bacterium]|nr:hypothetical protein [Deltaproteobacteria bacterium]
MDFGQLVEAHLEHERDIEGRRRRSRTNNASEIGDLCLRKLVYKRLRPEEAKAFDGGTLARFELGNLLERHVKRLLSDAGVEVIHAQVSSRWEAYNLSGHIDGMVVLGDYLRALKRLKLDYPPKLEEADQEELLVIEIKGLNPNAYRAISRPEDFLSHAWWTRRYLVQLVLYLWLEERERGLFLIFDKSGAGLKTIEVRRDDWIELAEETLRKAEIIEQVVAVHQIDPMTDTYVPENFPLLTDEVIEPEEYPPLPKRLNDPDVCRMCEYEHVCCPVLSYGPEIAVVEDDELATELLTRDRLDAARVEFKRLDERIKSRFELPADAQEAQWLVTGVALGEEESFEVVAKRSRNGSIRKTIRRLTAEEGENDS